MLSAAVHRRVTMRQVDHTFSSPICSTPLAGFGAHRAALARYATALRAGAAAGDNPVNHRGGWFSTRDLHRAPANEAMQWLVAAIQDEAAALIAPLTGLHSVAIKELWVNVSRGMHWMIPHTHGFDWCGTVYVQGAASGDANAGDTIFFNPAMGSARAGRRDHIACPQEPGVMRVFPGYLLHMVAPSFSEAERITYSFNLVAGR